MLHQFTSLIRSGCIYFFNQIYLYLNQVYFLSVRNTKDQHVSLVTVDPVTLLPASHQLVGSAPAYLSSGPKLSKSHSKFPPQIRKRERWKVTY